MDRVAQQYVQLTLAVGQHDANYVDAYYGPQGWRDEVVSQGASLSEIAVRAASARGTLGQNEPADLEPMDSLRWQNLVKQLEALIAKVRLLGGEVMSFDEESAALYDVVAPCLPDSEYSSIISRLASLLPGTGSLGERFEKYRSQFVVPPEKLEAVFDAAISAARERTKAHIGMEANESFRVEYVSDKVWGAYNWYQGHAHSLIQVNTDLPLTIDRAIHLACHEGYPGHHVYNALLERHLARDRDWKEFTVYPLFSPQSLIAEGTAEYGVELSFPEQDRLEYERRVLFPLAGLDSSVAEEFFLVRSLMEGLWNAGNDAARRYLDGQVSKQDTIDWLVEYTLSSPARATQRVRFFDANRSYVVTYGVGLQLVREWIESRAKSTEDRWRLFTELLSTPRTPSGLH